jgi:hypothetical protein
MIFDEATILELRLLDTVFPLFKASFFISLLVSIVIGFAQFSQTSFFRLFSVLFAFAVLASTVGLLTGASRDPVVGAVLPAILALAGGIAGTKLSFINSTPAGNPTNQTAPAIIGVLIVVGFSGVWMTFFGSSLRAISENNAYAAKMRLMETEHRHKQDIILLEKCIENPGSPVCLSFKR